MALKKTSRKSSRFGDVADLIISAEEVDPARVFLIYSRQGSGKTSLCATAPKPLIIDTERGTASIRRRKGTDVYRLNHFSEIDPIYWFLKGGKHDYETVAIDTITRLTSHALRYAMGDTNLDEARSIDDMQYPTKRDWGATTELMKDVILRFVALPMNIIFTAHETTYEAEEEEIVAGPVVNPGVRQVLLGHVDITGRLYVKEVKKEGSQKPGYERRLLIGPHESFESKDRSGDLPRIIRDPDMTKIIKQIRKEA